MTTVRNMLSCWHDLTEVALTYQWPLWSFCNPGATIHDMKRYNMGKVMSSATFMYCLVFAGATHHALSRYGTKVSQENVMLRLNYKTRALRSMSLDIESTGSQVSVEAMMTMLLLSAHGAAEKIQPPRAAENNRPLATAHMLDFYSRLPFEWAHLHALFALVKQRGGLAAVPKSSFTRALCMADIMTSFQTLSKPQFPLLKCFKSTLTSWPVAKSETSPLAQLLGSRFCRLPKSERFSHFKVVIKDIRTITIGYDRYQKNHFEAPILHQILSARLAALHDLLNLPTSSVNTAENCLYELCRHSTLAYMALALFPVSRKCGLHEELAKRIMALLDNADSFNLWSSYSKFLLWAAVMGGIMAKNTPLRAWFVNYLNDSGIKRTMVAWPPFNNLLTACLWLDSECDVEGLSLWNEAWDVTMSRAASV